MTKAQMLKRINLSAKGAQANMQQALECASKMNDYNRAVMAETVIATGSAIADTLNNIAIILCEMLPKEE